MKYTRSLLMAVALTCSAVVAQAQTVDNLLKRDSLLPPILSWLQEQGSKLTLIGEEGGLKGYLVESPTGKMQSVYVTPDGKHIVAGILVEMGGRNVTGVQIGEMRKRFDSAAEALNKAIDKEAADKADAGAGSRVQTNTSSTPAANSEAPAPTPVPDAKSVEKDAPTPEFKVSEPATPAASPAPAPAPSANSASTLAPASALEADPVVDPSKAAPADPKPVDAPSAPKASLDIPAAKGPVKGAEGNPSALWASKMDRDAFVSAAEKVPYFEVGSMTAPVTLWMVADPKCPYCHQAWDHIRPMVFAKKIKLRVVLINALTGSEPFVREILASPSAARRWIDSNAGTNLEPKVDPKSKAWADSARYMEMNMAFARQFGVDRTPFLGYVAPDGSFYTSLGLPSDLDSFLTASQAASN